MQFPDTNIGPTFASNRAYLVAMVIYLLATTTNHGNVSNNVISKYNQVFEVTI